MPTSATGTSATRRHRWAGRARGFTLIEILVVVGIIAVVSVGVLLSVNLVSGRDGELEHESDRLLALFKYARDEAALETREFGLRFDDDRYTFLVYDVHRQHWRAVTEDDALGERKLPGGLDLKLTLDGRPVVLKRPEDPKDLKPQVMIYSNGDLSAFAATLERDGGVRSVTITLDDKGEVIAQPLVEAKPR
ncbi:MAG: type II secretion system minor pseudopilin GspH [Proteobacteria bacterium]|nr:type II secretion system minor pseudopilin GspH [Pseudomonadota bacterium]